MVKRSSVSATNGAKAANGHAAAAALLGGSSPPKSDPDTANLLEELQAPFDPALIRWHAKEFKTIRSRRFGLFFPHGDPRAYKDRLNSLFGPMLWSDHYEITTIPSKILVVCTLTITPLGPHSHSATGEEWSRSENASTSAEAQAFKRSCAAFGLGRYLYYFPGVWLEVDGGTQPLTVPSLPEWAIPERWQQGLRPDPVARPIPPVIEPVNGNTVTRKSNCQNVVVQVLQMQEKLGTGLYRGLLKSVAQAWCPTDIRDIAVQKKVLRHMQGALRGLERFKVASEKLGEGEVVRILASFELVSAADIKDVDTLYRVVLVLEEAASTKP